MQSRWPSPVAAYVTTRRSLTRTYITPRFSDPEFQPLIDTCVHSRHPKASFAGYIWAICIHPIRRVRVRDRHEKLDLNKKGFEKTLHKARDLAVVPLGRRGAQPRVFHTIEFIIARAILIRIILHKSL